MRNKARPKKVYDFITAYVMKHGHSPTIDEIAEHLGVSDLTARRNVAKLAEQGKVGQKFNSPRSLRMTK